MPDLTGYVSIRNECGTTIKDVTLSVTVGGDVHPLIQDNALSDSLTTRNKKYSFPGGVGTDWTVSFQLKDTAITGTARCQLSQADNHQTLKIALFTDTFTLSPAASDPVTGRYDDAPSAPADATEAEKPTQKPNEKPAENPKEKPAKKATARSDKAPATKAK